MSTAPSTARPAKGHQVAALCWRRTPALEVLLITSLRSRRWIVPKGWLIAGMTPAQSAAREALEEAGVVGDIGAKPIGRFTYLKRQKLGAGTQCRVDIFPLLVKRQRRTWNEKGARELVWMPPEQAAARVEEPGLRRILLAFRRSGGPPSDVVKEP